MLAVPLAVATAVPRPGASTMLPYEPGAMSCEQRPLAGTMHSDDLLGPWCTGRTCTLYNDTTLTSCTTPGAPGYKTYTWLIGPYRSTGGYDWWMYEENLPADVLDMDGFAGVVANSISFHYGEPPASGAPMGSWVGLPPLHNHHTTFQLHGGVYEVAHAPYGEPCTGQHVSSKDAIACQMRDYQSNGFYQPFRANETHGFLTYLYNDVRPAGSPEITWYANLTVIVIDEDNVQANQLQPVYHQAHTHSFEMNSTFQTNLVPMDEDSFMFWEGTFTSNGHLVGSDELTHMNSHDSRMQYTLLLQASAAELGLNQSRFFSVDGCTVPPTSQAGFANNVELVAYMQAQCPSCFEAPRLLCNTTTWLGLVNGTGYQRMPHMYCSAALMPFRRGQPYVSLAMLGPPRESWYQSGGRPIPVYDATPSTYPMHIHWKLFYTTEDGMFQQMDENNGGSGSHILLKSGNGGNLTTGAGMNGWPAPGLDYDSDVCGATFADALRANQMHAPTRFRRWNSD